jgi:HPt (histidine-containing phosphotransfer) domain-containing protein
VLNSNLIFLDPAALEKLSPLNPPGTRDFVEELITDYLRSAAQKAEQILYAAKNKNWSELQLLSHGLKSSSATLGLNKLRDICLEIEKASSHKQVSSALQHLVPVLEHCLPLLRAQLRTR